MRTKQYGFSLDKATLKRAEQLRAAAEANAAARGKGRPHYARSVTGILLHLLRTTSPIAVQNVMQRNGFGDMKKRGDYKRKSIPLSPLENKRLDFMADGGSRSAVWRWLVALAREDTL